MDLGTILGLVCAFTALALSVLLEGGHLGSFINVPAALIVFGGTLGAVIIATPTRILMKMPVVIKQAFFGGKLMEAGEAIAKVVALSRRARREGLLALEAEINDAGDEFLKKGLQLVVDGTDGDVLRSILQAEIRNRNHRHQQGAGVFMEMGGLAPTLGVTGTVMGLVHMMEKLNDPSTMGPAIAAAFIATLYGVASANVVFIPLGSKLAARSDGEKFVHTLILEGLVSLQAGENTMTIEERLKTFLPPAQRRQEFGGGERQDQGAESERKAA